MAEGEHYIDQIFSDLDETIKLEILQVADIVDDRPSILRGEGGRGADRLEWMEPRRNFLLPYILRTTDLSDRQITRLVQDQDLTPGRTEWLEEDLSSIRFAFSPQPSYNVPVATSDYYLPITELASASAIMCEMFVSLAAANRPFGIFINPPDVGVNRGSIEFTVGGGMFATGMGLLVSCSAGIVTAPVIGPIAGIAVASVGLLELALAWKKQVAETRKIEEETRILRIQNDVVTVTQSQKIRELEIKQKELELEKARVQAQEEKGTRFAYSSLVDQETVRLIARHYDLTESYVNHILNRSLPHYLALKQYTVGVSVEEPQQVE